jgi:hypothetical protein
MDDFLLDGLIEILVRIRKCEDKEKRERALKIFYDIFGLLLEV